MWIYDLLICDFTIYLLLPAFCSLLIACCIIFFHPACGALHRSELCSSELMQYKSATQRKFNSYSVAGVHKNFTSPTSYHPCVE